MSTRQITSIMIYRWSDETMDHSPVRVLLWWPRTKSPKKPSFQIQPLELEGGISDFCTGKFRTVCMNWVSPHKKLSITNILSSITSMLFSPLYFDKSCLHQLQQSWWQITRDIHLGVVNLWHTRERINARFFLWIHVNYSPLVYKASENI